MSYEVGGGQGRTDSSQHGGTHAENMRKIRPAPSKVEPVRLRPLAGSDGPMCIYVLLVISSVGSEPSSAGKFACFVYILNIPSRFRGKSTRRRCQIFSKSTRIEL